MFCPKCGKAEQSPETFCRQCGVFLPDLEKTGKTPVKPEVHVQVNLVFSILTMISCFTLAILLYSMLAFRDDTHPLIYASAGLLTAMGFWHTQTFWRSILLRSHFKKNRHPREASIESVLTDRRLGKPGFESMVPESVTDQTTKQLSETKLRSS